MRLAIASQQLAQRLFKPDEIYACLRAERFSPTRCCLAGRSGISHTAPARTPVAQIDRTSPQSAAIARTLVKPLNLFNAISDVAEELTANAPVGDSENVAVLTTPERTWRAKD